MWRKSLILIVSIVALYTIAILSGVGLSIHSKGTFDFMQYWSAWHLMSVGQNPYDAQLMQAKQAVLGQVEGIPVMMWNPPWTLVILSPILIFGFERAAFLWFLTQIVCVVGIVGVTRSSAKGTKAPVLLCGAVAVGFLPIIDNLLWGQIGVLLAFGVAIFVAWQSQAKLFWAGCALSLLTIKPHLFLVGIIPGLIWLCQLRRSDALAVLLGAFAAFLTLMVVTLLIQPLSVSQWVDALLSPPRVAGVVAPSEWQTATLSTWIRVAFLQTTGELPTWPMGVVPTCSFIGATLFFAIKKPLVSWSRMLCPVLCISLLGAGYGWLYDQSVLLVCLIQLVCEAWSYRNRTHRILIVGGVVLIEAMAFAVGELTEGAQHYFAWIPAAVLVLWFLNERLKRSNRCDQLPSSS
jgi:hypothetical protein